MRLKLTLKRLESADDVLVTLDAAATVGDLAAAIVTMDPVRPSEGAPHPGNGTTVRNHGFVSAAHAENAVVLDPDLPVLESGLRSGAHVSIASRSDWNTASEVSRGQAVALLRVVAGVNAGSEFALYEGTNHIGRDLGNDIALQDPRVSKRHARLTVSGGVDIVDLGSANGVIVDGVQVQRATLTADNAVLLGDTVVAVQPLRKPAAGADSSVEFNRPPLVRPVFAGEEIEAPELPSKPRSVQFPFVSIVAPLIVGAVLFVATRNTLAILFIGLSPLLIIGSLFDQHRQQRRETREQVEAFDQATAYLRERLSGLRLAEARSRLHESPSTAEAAESAELLASTLWCRRPDLPGFMTVRLGLGRLPSRTTLKLAGRGPSLPGFWERLHDLGQEFSHIDDVPVVGDFRRAGGIGIAGPTALSTGVARSIAIQLVCQHSPAELVVTAVGGANSAVEWEWLKWLPHVGSGHSPVHEGSLANSAPAAMVLVSKLEELVAQRLAERQGEEPDAAKGADTIPAVLVIVMDDAPIERSRLVQLAERGPGVGVFALWLAGSVGRIPASCRAFTEIGAEGEAGVGLVRTTEHVLPVHCESVDGEVALLVARRLARVVDSGARVEDDDSDLPRSVSFLAVMGTDVATSHEAILERWRASDPALLAAERIPHNQRLSLRGVVGQAAGEPFHLDLRTQGPHALVGGTTGAGKSEFLQTWVLGMAAMHSPKRLTFLFVDYKGGSAFASCVQLPHSVGLVTDLSPHLVRRALTSLRAELRRRERILEHKGAKDLIDLEKSGDPDAPPSLVIIVDEFAALIHEVPEFIDGVVDVAQRGRSLGLHLVLATQQPSGVITGKLRANTNLRVALRMADADDSNDVLGDPMAGGFDPSIPGRAAAKTGPGRIISFQSLYAGGTTADEPSRPSVSIESLVFGVGKPWTLPESAKQKSSGAEGFTDIERVVEQAHKAAEAIELPPPRKPWLETLAAVYDLEMLEQQRDNTLMLGVQDDPAEQEHRQVAFRPDEDGNMAIFGAGGSGRSAALRTVAMSAANTPHSGPCDVYGLDFGARGLTMLESLPHVGAVILGDEHERVARLLRFLREEIEIRSRKYVEVRASTLTEYRTLAEEPQEPRILLLLDGMAAFRQEYELGSRSAWFNTFGQIAADGRPVGIHVVLTADRPSSVPPALSATIQRRLVLRLADANDYMAAGVPADVLGADSPPGRGLIGGLETQVAVLGGSANVAAQSRAIERVKDALERQGRRLARPIESLPERVTISDLPNSVGGAPVIGLEDDVLAPIGLAPAGTFLIVGPQGSGRTTCTASIVTSTFRAFPGAPAYFFGAKRSQLLSLTQWTEKAVDEEEASSLATRLEQEIASGVITATDLKPVIIVLDSVSSFFNGMAESPLQTMVSTADANDVFVIAEGETSTITQSYQLGRALRARRRGLVLQPDDLDGTKVFRATFPRMSRSEFPPGRGMLVDSGKIVRVQVALPE